MNRRSEAESPRTQRSFLDSLRNLTLATRKDAGAEPEPWVEEGAYLPWDDFGVHARAREVSRRKVLGRIGLAVGGTAAMAAVAASMLRKRFDFYTDFSEYDPLRFWRNLKSSSLSVEPFDGKMSAVPAGPSLLEPSGGMANGVAAVHFNLTLRKAEFVLRGVDENNCYLLSVSRGSNANSPTLNLVVRKRKGGIEEPVLRAEVTDLHWANLAAQRLDIEMDGPNFAVWLNRPVEQQILGYTVHTRTERTLITNWRDGEFRDGFMGVSGAPERARRRDDDFRLYSVGLSG